MSRQYFICKAKRYQKLSKELKEKRKIWGDEIIKQFGNNVLYELDGLRILGFKKVEDTKSSNAKRVQQLMDSCEDGASRYMEFVKLVSSEANVTIESLEVELEPYI